MSRKTDPSGGASHAYTRILRWRLYSLSFSGALCTCAVLLGRGANCFVTLHTHKHTRELMALNGPLWLAYLAYGTRSHFLLQNILSQMLRDRRYTFSTRHIFWIGLGLRVSINTSPSERPFILVALSKMVPLVKYSQCGLIPKNERCNTGFAKSLGYL